MMLSNSSSTSAASAFDVARPRHAVSLPGLRMRGGSTTYGALPAEMQSKQYLRAFGISWVTFWVSIGSFPAPKDCHPGAPKVGYCVAPLVQRLHDGQGPPVLEALATVATLEGLDRRVASRPYGTRRGGLCLSS
jgi:hypothetical protein